MTNVEIHPQDTNIPTATSNSDVNDSSVDNKCIDMSFEEKLKIIKLDSRDFGFIEIENHPRKLLIKRAIIGLEKILAKQCKLVNENSEDNRVQPKIYRILGHLNLLLENYHKALSAFQKCFKLQKTYWKDAPLLYGLGIVYFHFNAYQWATKAFQQVLYIDPSFSRTNEVHIRLGLILKLQCDFDTSLKHLRLALVDCSDCSLSKHELKFHIAHAYELQGKWRAARDQYEAVIAGGADVPHNVIANAYRQLGWLYHSIDAIGDRQTREETAIKCLQNAINANGSCGQSWYLLGRCYSAAGKVHDAFMSYRQSIDKSEASADTWCSIGVLYQQQSQPMDALQAYICAVQLDKTHTAAWVDLGILYESCQQPRDALTCYLNATQHGSASINPSLQARIKLLETQLSKVPLQTLHRNKTLPGIEEAWSLPIPAELTSRQGATTPSRSTSVTPSINDVDSSPSAKRFKKDSVPPIQQIQSLPQTMSIQQQNSVQPLNQQQLQLLHCLQQQDSLTLSQNNRIILQELQAQYLAYQQQQQQQQQQQFEMPLTVSLPQQVTIQQQNSQSGQKDDLQNTVSDQDITDFLQKHDIDSSIAEDLLAQFTKNTSQSDTDNAGSPGFSELSKTGDDWLESLECISDLPPTLLTPVTPSLNIHMRAQSIVDSCKGIGSSGIFTGSLLPDDSPPPCPPDDPKPILPKEKLHPATPSVYLDNKKDAFSQELQHFCLSQNVCIVRGLAGALKLDLGLFSTKSLVENNPDHPVEVRTQRHFAPDENRDGADNPVWRCESSRSYTTILKYAQYQASSFQESLKEEQDRNKGVLKDEEIQVKKKKIKLIKFGTNVDLSDDKKWSTQLQELSKLPSFAKVVAGNNMLSHIHHTILGMNSVQLYMKVPGSRTPGHQENNNFCSVNINIGPGDCEWFTVPEPYWGSIHRLCEKHNINYLTGSWWPMLEELEEHRIPVYRFIQKPGDLVWVGSGSVHWVQAIGWCNNIAWNVGPITAKQYSLALERYEYNKLQSHKSIVPIVFLSWNLARNIKMTDIRLFEQVKFVLMRNIRYTALIIDYFESINKVLNFQGVDRGEPAHYCHTCEVEVFNILLVTEHEKKQCHVVYCLDCAKRISPDLSSFIALNQYNISELLTWYNDFQLGAAV